MEIFSKKIVSNSIWMIVEKFLGIFGLIFVTSYVAKYIGPTNFGKIAFTTTIFAFVQSFVWFGNQEILFKRVSKNKDAGLRYLIGTQKMRTYIFILLSIPIFCVLGVLSDRLTLIFGIATGLAAYFITQDIFNIYNNAVLKSYINAISNTLGLCVALLARYFIILYELPYEYLAIPIVLVTFIPYLLKIMFFNKKTKIRYGFHRFYQQYYIFAGSALLLSSLSVAFYTQITSFLLGVLQSSHALGIYAAALPLGVSWSFVNVAIITSVLSRIYSEKNVYRSYEMVFQLNIVIILIGLVVSGTLFLLGQSFIEMLYGTAFSQAHNILIILSLATMFSGLGTVAARLMIKEESYSYISKKMLVVAIISFPVAWVFIYYWGINGAAYSMFLIELLSATIFNYFYKNGLIFKVQFFPFFKKYLYSVYKS